MPRVSIILAVHNSSGTIASALESIVRQTFTDWECIICDDGSTDGTLELVRNSIKDSNSKFILLSNSENCGAAHARNRCIDIAGGEYIAIQDADDTSYPTRFEEQVKFVDSFPDVSIVGSYATLSDNSKECWGKLQAPETPKKVDWLKGSQIIHASSLMRRKDVLAIGKYDERLSRAEDYDLFVRMVAQGFVIRTLPKVLYDIHWDLSDYLRKTKKYRWNDFKVRLKALKMFDIAPYNAIYLLKPLFVGAIPAQLLYKHHYKKFKRNERLI